MTIFSIRDGQMTCQTDEYVKRATIDQRSVSHIVSVDPSRIVIIGTYTSIYTLAWHSMVVQRRVQQRQQQRKNFTEMHREINVIDVSRMKNDWTYKNIFVTRKQ